MKKSYKTHWRDLPMHIDMSPYAPFYHKAIEQLLVSGSKKERKTIVEIGTRYGCSARIMLDVLPEDQNWKLIMIDPIPTGFQEELTGARIEYWKGLGEDFADQFKRRSLSLIHVDADPHGYEQTKGLFVKFEDKLKVGGAFIFHDASPSFGVRMFVDELAEAKDSWEVTYCDPHPDCPISAPAIAIKLK